MLQYINLTFNKYPKKPIIDRVHKICIGIFLKDFK